MKKCIIVIIAVLCSFLGVKMLFAVPDTWTQKTDFGGTARSNAVGFSIGGKGCIGTDWRDPIEKDFWEYEPTPMTLTVASSNPDSGVSITVNPTAVELTTTQIIPLHYEIMRNTPFEPGEETGGSVFMVILPSMVGSREIALDDASEMKSKLFVYRGTDGKYHTNVVERIDHNTIICRHPLEADIDIGKTVFHFYANLNHPGEEGYYAIADQALSHLAGNLNNRIHVLLGDSWFNAPYIRTRLLESLPEASIIGAGGSGNRAAQLLARFDADVTPHKPDYVWIMAGTNDYFNVYDIPLFISQLKELESKIKAIGAVAIIFDVSVGPESYPGVKYNLHVLSSQYADAVIASFGGSLQVTINPQGVMDAGGQWRLVGTMAWFNSGSTETEIPIGSYEVEFKSVTGWTTPSSVAVTISSGQKATASRTYVQQTDSGGFYFIPNKKGGGAVIFL